MSFKVAHDLESSVIDSVRSFSGFEGEIQPEDDLQEDLGIDSVEVVELLAELLTAAGAGHRRVDADRIATVADLRNTLLEVMRETEA
jgi:acyl carrier protein